jgi:hypothetical protein
MRAIILAFAVGLALAASTEAAPVWHNKAEIGLGAAPIIELVRDGCGRGWHRDHWRDQRGNWQWGDCVPNEGGYGYDGPILLQHASAGNNGTFLRTENTNQRRPAL